MSSGGLTWVKIYGITDQIVWCTDNQKFEWVFYFPSLNGHQSNKRYFLNILSYHTKAELPSVTSVQQVGCASYSVLMKTTWLEKSSHVDYALQITDFSMASIFSTSLDDAEVKTTQYSQQKNPSSSKYWTIISKKSPPTVKLWFWPKKDVLITSSCKYHLTQNWP